MNEEKSVATPTEHPHDEEEKLDRIISEVSKVGQFFDDFRSMLSENMADQKMRSLKKDLMDLELGLVKEKNYDARTVYAAYIIKTKKEIQALMNKKQIRDENRNFGHGDRGAPTKFDGS